MATVAGIRFKKAGKVYYFDPTGVWPNPGDHVIVETIRGIEMGEAVTGAREVADDSLVAPLKKIIRIATPEDIQHAESCAAREQTGQQRGAERGGKKFHRPFPCRAAQTSPAAPAADRRRRRSRSGRRRWPPKPA